MYWSYSYTEPAPAYRIDKNNSKECTVTIDLPGLSNKDVKLQMTAAGSIDIFVHDERTLRIPITQSWEPKSAKMRDGQLKIRLTLKEDPATIIPIE